LTHTLASVAHLRNKKDLLTNIVRNNNTNNTNTNKNNNYYYYYQLQLSCHPVAVVLTLVHTKQE